MEPWRTTGSFRQRARSSAQATQQLKEHRRHHAAARTREALDRFDSEFEAEQEAMFKDFDDLPAEAGYMRMSETTPGGMQDQFNMTYPQQPSSQPQLHGLERNPCVQRPTSALAVYDYGNLSLRPKSLAAQQRQQLGQPNRLKHRQSSCGFYFPGTQSTQGSYGFSMLDPCLLPPQSWAKSSTSAPTSWVDGANKARPMDAQELASRRSRSLGSISLSSHMPRTTSAQTLRARRAAQALKHRWEEASLEQARFEKGVCDGCWRDPLLDSHGEVPMVAAPEEHEWLDLPNDLMTPAQQTASKILFGLCDVLQRFKGGLLTLFAAENMGGPGVLEPASFLRGLERLGVLCQGEVSMGALLQAISIIHLSSDGRVRLLALGRAVSVARGVRQRQQQATEQLNQERQVLLSNKYSATLPVDVVKLDRESKSLYDFERSLQKFRTQQKELLVLHNEQNADHE